MKFKNLLVSTLIICAFSATLSWAEKPLLLSSQNIRNMGSTNGVLYQQPHGPFAVMLFNESAQGIHLGVIYYKQMEIPVVGKWWISQRFWQEKPWNEDITSFAWDKDNKHLYIGTSEVYGDGGLFKLDLYDKTFQKLYPATAENQEILSTEIIAYDEKSGALTVSVMNIDETTSTVKVSTK